MADNNDVSLKIGQVRISRPTNQLDQVLQFYCEGLGLTRIFSFSEDAAGYSGVVLGLYGHPYYLEFCTHSRGFSNCRPPGADNLLIFYLDTPIDLGNLERRMKRLGYPASQATNPHWDQNGITFEDPDGWRVVIMLESNVQENQFKSGGQNEVPGH
jgi:hypothetical protein